MRVVWAGVGLTDLGSEAMDIIKGLAGIVAAHYPERLYRSGVFMPHAASCYLDSAGIFQTQCSLLQPGTLLRKEKSLRS